MISHHFAVSRNVLLEEFSKYGEVRNVFLKPNCDPGRQSPSSAMNDCVILFIAKSCQTAPTRHWGFITFATSQQAMDAKAGPSWVSVSPKVNQCAPRNIMVQIIDEI